MKKRKDSLIKKGKSGLLYWLASCLLGSIIVAGIERHLFNQTEGFYMSISAGIILWIWLSVIAFFGSSPVILIIYLLSKRLKNLSRLITTALVLSFAFDFLIALALSKNYFEALYLTIPYFVSAFIFEIFYLKIERSVTLSF